MNPQDWSGDHSRSARPAAGPKGAPVSPRPDPRPAPAGAASVPGDVLLGRLRGVVGAANVLTGDQATRRFRKGHRTGEGPVLAVVRPGSLLELWQVLQVAVAADRIVIMQAANTGLTDGSTPVKFSLPS